MTEIGIMTSFAEAVVKFGFPLILSIFLIWYVYKNQRELNVENKKRETIAYEREIEHRGFIDSLKNDLSCIARENNDIVKIINRDVDTVHNKIIGLGNSIDNIKMDVQTIRGNVDHIRFVGIHVAKDDEE